LAAAVAVALAASGIASPSLAQAADPPAESDTLLHYDFEAPGAVTDVSGHGNDGALLGTGGAVADGVLTLPGGAASSAAGYVQFPDGIFDGHDTLTISTWLRNETGPGNYAAMFFGTPENPPAQYWLLNPSNLASQLKTVVTGEPDRSAPWNSEFGIAPTDDSRGVPGPVTGTEWMMITTVITADSITGYHNGELIGEVAVPRTVSDFGTDLVGYIGRSSYPDIFYAGAVDDVIVSTAAYDPAQVAALYYSSARTPADEVLAALTSDADAVALPAQTITDIALPTTGLVAFSAITWESSDPAVLSADGAVARPAVGQTDAVVTLTATFTLAGQTVTRTYDVTVPAVDPQRDLERVAADFDLGVAVVTDDITLASHVGDVRIGWSSANPALITALGRVTRPETDTAVDLTATFTHDGLSVERVFTVTVRATAVGDVVAYVRTGGTPRTEVLHLAIAADGDPLVALNNNKGILYPTYGLGSSRFANPTLFRLPDGGYGLIATDNAANGSVFVYRSDDLVTFTDERYVSTNDIGIVVARADAFYDTCDRVYKVTLRTADGSMYLVTTTDFVEFSDPVVGGEAIAPSPTGLPEGAIEASSMRITRDELNYLQTKLGRITNTSVDPGPAVEVATGGELAMPSHVSLGYSDGSAKQLGVTWDTSAVDLTQPGTYTATGTVNQPVYGDAEGILVRERADPWVLRDDERTGSAEYYLTGSYPTTMENPRVGYDRIVLRRAETINGLTTAEENTLLWASNAAAPDTSNGSTIAPGAFRYFWAPELHKIAGDWYILFTASRESNSTWGIRPALMRAPGDSDPMVASNWEFLGYMKAFPGDTAAFTNFSLDMTHFELDGKHYMVWAEKPGASDLRMAEIDPSDPSQLTTPSILLSTPQYAWEREGGDVINEGASVIMSETEVFVFFSASAVDETYAIGMLRAPIDADLMDPAVWHKTGYPLLDSEDFDNQQRGPGHNSFTLDADGNPVIVYHARPPVSEWLPGADGGLNDPSRHARVKTVHFAADGSAVLNQTRDEELAPENQTVTLDVIVTGDPLPEPSVSATVTHRCVVGKVVRIATVTNDRNLPVSVTTTLGVGGKTTEAVAPGESVSHLFSTRLVDDPAGTLTVTVAPSDGGEVETHEIAYPEASCG
jgi:GH43 family beta-xylosidase